MLDEFFQAFAGAPKPFLLLDYDGTLAPFRLDRFQARPWAGVRELLGAIQTQGRTRMRVITGRPANEIHPLLGLDPPLEVWGLHGAEHLFPDGRRELEEASPVVQMALDEVRESLRRDSFGGLFEDKANGAVMHWRGVSQQDAERIEQQTRRLFEPLARMEGLSLLEFEAGIELRDGPQQGRSHRGDSCRSRRAGRVSRCVSGRRHHRRSGVSHGAAPRPSQPHRAGPPRVARNRRRTAGSIPRKI